MADKAQLEYKYDELGDSVPSDALTTLELMECGIYQTMSYTRQLGISDAASQTLHVAFGTQRRRIARHAIQCDCLYLA